MPKKSKPPENQFACAECGDVFIVAGDTITLPFVCYVCRNDETADRRPTDPQSVEPESNTDALIADLKEQLDNAEKDLASARVRYQEAEAAEEVAYELIRHLDEEIAVCHIAGELQNAFFVGNVKKLKEKNDWQAKQLIVVSENLGKTQKELAAQMEANDALSRENYNLKERLRRLEWIADIHLARIGNLVKELEIAQLPWYKAVWGWFKKTESEHYDPQPA